MKSLLLHKKSPILQIQLHAILPVVTVTQVFCFRIQKVLRILRQYDRLNRVRPVITYIVSAD